MSRRARMSKSSYGTAPTWEEIERSQSAAALTPNAKSPASPSSPASPDSTSASATSDAASTDGTPTSPPMERKASRLNLFGKRPRSVTISVVNNSSLPLFLMKAEQEVSHGSWTTFPPPQIPCKTRATFTLTAKKKGTKGVVPYNTTREDVQPLRFKWTNMPNEPLTIVCSVPMLAYEVLKEAKLSDPATASATFIFMDRDPTRPLKSNLELLPPSEKAREVEEGSKEHFHRFDLALQHAESLPAADAPIGTTSLVTPSKKKKKKSLVDDTGSPSPSKKKKKPRAPKAEPEPAASSTTPAVAPEPDKPVPAALAPPAHPSMYLPGPTPESVPTPIPVPLALPVPLPAPVASPPSPNPFTAPAPHKFLQLRAVTSSELFSVLPLLEAADFSVALSRLTAIVPAFAAQTPPEHRRLVRFAAQYAILCKLLLQTQSQSDNHLVGMWERAAMGLDVRPEHEVIVWRRGMAGMGRRGEVNELAAAVREYEARGGDGYGREILRRFPECEDSGRWEWEGRWCWDTLEPVKSAWGCNVCGGVWGQPAAKCSLCKVGELQVA